VQGAGELLLFDPASNAPGRSVAVGRQPHWMASYYSGRAVAVSNEGSDDVSLVDLTQRMGLDPARIFSALSNQPPPNPMGLSDEDLKDPAVKFIADHLGKTNNELNAIRGELQQRDQRERQAREEAGFRSAKSNVDSFADEKGKDGRLLHPHFDAVLSILVDLFKANPDRDIAEAYETACWAHPEVRKQLLQAEQFRNQSQNDIQKARIAQRSNARGLTTPVQRPNGADGPSKGGIRDTIERSADEVGF